MDEATRQMAEGLREAMQAERTGYEFYMLAAKNTEDPEGKATFEQLAKEEREHFEFLRSHYKALLETGKLAEGVTLTDHAPLRGDSPIFSQALRDRLKGAHFEMSALAIAVQLELNGIRHYTEQASRAALPEARAFFQQLVDWENSHYEALLQQQQLLQEDYWRDNAFEPF
jgi:rubrerythrin